MAPASWPTFASAGGAADVSLPSQRPFRLSLPTSYYSSGQPPALLLHFHGWGGTLSSGAMFHEAFQKHHAVVVSPLGFDDDGTQPASWNGGGTNAGTGLSTCHDPAGAFSSMCYRSSCQRKYGGCNRTCWWTTCEDSVGQIEALLLELHRALCFDPRAVFATGVSNGGMFLYELAASPLASQFAAFMPLVGSPHRGFNRAPRGEPVPFFGLWGRNDDTIPPIANPHVRGHPGDPNVSIDTRYGGWYFATATAVTTAWAQVNRCHNATQPPTSVAALAERAR